jgi:hypothetical protein
MRSNYIPDFILTEKRLSDISRNGTLTRAVAEALGLPYPLFKGWKSQVVGRKITEKFYWYLYNLNANPPAKPTVKTIADIPIIKNYTFSTNTYYKSKRWQAIHAFLRRQQKYRECMFCQNMPIQLHHISYHKVNTPDEVEWVWPVCRTCHNKIHDIQKAENCTAKLASYAFYKQHFGHVCDQELSEFIQGKQK